MGPSGTGTAGAMAGRAGPLFLLDGNNVAYRASSSLPESIATQRLSHQCSLTAFC